MRVIKKEEEEETTRVLLPPRLHSHLSDFAVCQAPKRPNPPPVYYASETAEAIHARWRQKEKKKKSAYRREPQLSLDDRTGLSGAE